MSNARFPAHASFRLALRSSLGVGIAAVLGTIGPSCIDRPLVNIEPGSHGVHSDVLRVTRVDKVDLLFVVDNSSSMADKQSLCTLGHLEAGNPELLGKQMGALATRLPDVDIWGGCCGTWDDHLRAVAQQLRPVESAV